jgi:hypothetical protein
VGLDDPRYLGAKIGYVTFPTVDPIECITEAEQQRQTAQAHWRWAEEQRRAWGQAHETITGALTQFPLSVRVDRRTSSDLRAIERTAQRIDKRVSGA